MVRLLLHLRGRMGRCVDRRGQDSKKHDGEEDSLQIAPEGEPRLHARNAWPSHAC
jgi:hypothetical protein